MTKYKVKMEREAIKDILTKDIKLSVKAGRMLIESDPNNHTYTISKEDAYVMLDRAIDIILEMSKQKRKFKR